jgi:hypothetical protein
MPFLKKHHKPALIIAAALLALALIFCLSRPQSAQDGLRESTGITATSDNIIYSHLSNSMSTEQYTLLSFSSEQTKDILSNQTLFHECSQSTAVCPSQWIDASDNATAPHPASNRSDYTPAQRAISEETNKSPTKCTFIAWASDNQKLSADTALRESTTKKTFCINPQTGHAQYAYLKL